MTFFLFLSRLHQIIFSAAIFFQNVFFVSIIGDVPNSSVSEHDLGRCLRLLSGPRPRPRFSRFSGQHGPHRQTRRNAQTKCRLLDGRIRRSSDRIKVSLLSNNIESKPNLLNGTFNKCDTFGPMYTCNIYWSN